MIETLLYPRLSFDGTVSIQETTSIFSSPLALLIHEFWFRDKKKAIYLKDLLSAGCSLLDQQVVVRSGEKEQYNQKISRMHLLSVFNNLLSYNLELFFSSFKTLISQDLMCFHWMGSRFDPMMLTARPDIGWCIPARQFSILDEWLAFLRRSREFRIRIAGSACPLFTRLRATRNSSNVRDRHRNKIPGWEISASRGQSWRFDRFLLISIIIIHSTTLSTDYYYFVPTCLLPESVQRKETLELRKLLIHVRYSDNFLEIAVDILFHWWCILLNTVLFSVNVEYLLLVINLFSNFLNLACRLFSRYISSYRSRFRSRNA